MIFLRCHTLFHEYKLVISQKVVHHLNLDQVGWQGPAYKPYQYFWGELVLLDTMWLKIMLVLKVKYLGFYLLKNVLTLAYVNNTWNPCFIPSTFCNDLIPRGFKLAERSTGVNYLSQICKWRVPLPGSHFWSRWGLSTVNTFFVRNGQNMLNKQKKLDRNKENREIKGGANFFNQ